MTATGKKARKTSGLTHAQCRRANHTPKSAEKIKKMRWIRDPQKGTNYRHS